LFASYTATGFVNSLVYLDQLPSYRTWVLVMIWLCIAVLVAGVVMLSSKRTEPKQKRDLGNFSSAADPEGEAQQTAFALKNLGGDDIEEGRPDGRPEKSDGKGGTVLFRTSEEESSEDEVDGLPDDNDGQGSLPGYHAVAGGEDEEFGGFVGEGKR
jgi:hypothetical protein